MTNEELSNCCEEPVIVQEAVTKHYICSSCKEPCDLWRDEVPMPVEWKTREERLEGGENK